MMAWLQLAFLVVAMTFLLMVSVLFALAIWAGSRKPGKAARKEYPFEMEGQALRRALQSGDRRRQHPSKLSNIGKAPAAGRWIAPGETIDLPEARYSGGMVYVGSSLASPSNCLIDPSLKVSGPNSRAGKQMPYWPAYSQIGPSHRRGYIEWLVDGRSDPQAEIGYVFLFFYGLERRLFLDDPKQDSSYIIAEVQRLLKIYSDNSSFRSYAARLLDAAHIVFGDDRIRPDLSPGMWTGYEMPMAVRVYLGRLLQSGKPLEADDALLWLLASPDIALRTAAVRCFDELLVLWRIRFGDKYDKGLRVRAPKAHLQLMYRLACGASEIDISKLRDQELPDITALSAPLNALRQLLEVCTQELAPYSRYLGRRPDARGTVDAAHLLPKEIFFKNKEPQINEAWGRIEELFADRPLIITDTKQLITALGLSWPNEGKVNTEMASQLGAILDRFDIGYEPDRRYGPAGPSVHLVLFKSPGGAPVDPDAVSFKVARTMIEIAAMAAVADGEVAAEELSAIGSDLRKAEGITDVERSRLLARATLLLKSPERQRAALGRFAKLPDSEKKVAANAAINAVLADGHVAPTEVKFLERLFKAFGYPANDVYAMLHRGGVTFDEPVCIATAEPSSGIRIPPPNQSTAGAATGEVIKIDSARLERLKMETSVVSNLLAEIFVEDTPLPVLPTAASSSRPSIFSGLDAAHGELLAIVLAANAVSREEFDDRARALRLLPDGAIETINDWGFETFDEVILEDGHEISVVTSLRASLEQRKSAA